MAEIEMEDDDLPGTDLTNEQKIDKYRELKIFDSSITVFWKHVDRSLQDVTFCYICKGAVGPMKQKFEMGGCVDYLVECGHRTCSYKLHMSCITFRRFIFDHYAQYSCLKQNMGTILCPDHYCETCMGHGYQQSAARGSLVICGNQHRAYHVGCLPPVPIQEGEDIQLVPRPQEFNSTHFPICYCCGKLDLIDIPAQEYQPARGGQEAVPKREAQKASKLIGCAFCVNMFHAECHEINVKGGNETKCEDCIYDTQFRRSDSILVKGKKLFRAARMINSRVANVSGESQLQVEISFLTAEKPGEAVETQWVPINEIFRPYPMTAAQMYHSIREIYMEEECKDHECKEHVKELIAIRDMLHKLYRFSPGIKRETPKIQNTYQFHESFLKGRSQYFNLPPELKCSEDVEVRMTKWKGYGLFAKRKLEAGHVIGFYVGEFINQTEKFRRSKLATMSNDKEVMSYVFETCTKRGKEQETRCYIDSASHLNETSFLNSCCLPNCDIVTVPHELVDGISVDLYKIVTKTEIEENTELTINYNWKELKSGDKCLCDAPACKEKRSKLQLDWGVQYTCDGRKVSRFLKRANSHEDSLDCGYIVG